MTPDFPKTKDQEDKETKTENCKHCLHPYLFTDPDFFPTRPTLNRIQGGTEDTPAAS